MAAGDACLGHPAAAMMRPPSPCLRSNTRLLAHRAASPASASTSTPCPRAVPGHAGPRRLEVVPDCSADGGQPLVEVLLEALQVRRAAWRLAGPLGAHSGRVAAWLPRGCPHDAARCSAPSST